MGFALCGTTYSEGPPDLPRTASKHVFKQELIVLVCLCIGGHTHGHSWVEGAGFTDTSGTQSALSSHSILKMGRSQSQIQIADSLENFKRWSHSISVLFS